MVNGCDETHFIVVHEVTMKIGNKNKQNNITQVSKLYGPLSRNLQGLFPLVKDKTQQHQHLKHLKEPTIKTKTFELTGDGLHHAL